MLGVMDKERLADIVGKGNVFDDEETLKSYAGDESFLPGRKPSFVVRPGSRDEVVELVRLANETRVPLVPVSSGPPHFRGDTVPEYGGIVLDLSRMDRILFVDREDRVAMIEPGVRFGELQEALREEGLKLPVPLCPRDTKSVVGSCLEREPHTIPKYHLDHSDPLSCAEVVFGTGDVFCTGEAAGPGTIEDKQRAGWRQKIRVEPQTELVRLVQGAQGTMGIVTWVTVRCEVLPGVQRPLLAAGDDLCALLEYLYRLVRMRLCDEAFILDAADAAALLAEEGDVEALQERLPEWVLLFCISGYRILPEERVAILEKEAREAARFCDLTLQEAVAGVTAERVLEVAGNPSKGKYWKLRKKGGCQDVYFISPFDGIAPNVELMREYLGRSGLSPGDVGVYLQPVCQGHGYHCEFNIFYDREDGAEKERVREAYLSLCRSLLDNGAFFSRPYDLLPEMVYARDAVTRDVLRKVKGVFDPNDVLNPGKLCF